MQHAAGRIEQQFRTAAETDPTLSGLGQAYDELLAEKELITVLLHGFTAGSDPEIGPVVRACFGRIYDTVREVTGAGIDEVRDFLGVGMLLTILGTMNVIGPDAVPAQRWMTDLVGSVGLSKTCLGSTAD